MRVAGLGCRRLCPAADIVGAIRAAERAAGVSVDALAAPAFKQGEPGLHEAAALLGLPMHFLDAAAMARAQPGCVTPSDAALRATGYASIAEAAALAATGGSLILPRLDHGGATCAIAGPGPGSSVQHTAPKADEA